MSLFAPTISKSVLVLVDLQPSFLKAIHESDRVLRRSRFLAKVASLLEAPVIGTVQNPERMGGIEESLIELLSAHVDPKMAFSCLGCQEFVDRFESLNRNQAILVGIETHICVSQTAHGLLSKGYEVAVCADAVGARTLDRHEIGLSRMRDAGVTLAHTESIAYEWIGGADHPMFREALDIVKAFP